jgi:hypothetical protein
MDSRASVFPIVICISLLFLSAPVLAAPVLDQFQDVASEKSVAYWDGVLLAQTFTAGQSGVLDHVSIGQTVGMSDIGTPIGIYPTTIEIRDTTAGGLPGTTVLGTASAPSGFTNGWNDIDFLSENITMTPGTTYSIVLQNNNASFSNFTNADWDPASYTPGALYYNYNNGGWNSNFSFVNAAYSAGGDAQFRTYVTGAITPPPEPNPNPTIPAPGALALAGLGLACVRWLRRR